MSYDIFADGHDFGNSETCSVLVGRGARSDHRMPSISSSGSWKRVLASAQGTGKNVKDVLQSNHYVLEYDQETPDGVHHVEKYVGQKVFDDGEKALETRGDSSRYWLNNYNLEALMVSAASRIPDPEFGLYVVTGMPIQTYLDDVQNAERVSQSLLGTRHFRLNGVDRTMHVLKAKCIMEGAGALIAYGSTENELQGVVDIGGHTTDLFMARGQKAQPARCKGVAKGVASASDLFSVKFREQFGYTPSLEKRMELLRLHIREQPYGQIIDKSRKVIEYEALYQLIESSLRETGQEIATQIAAAWDEVTMELSQILVVGGGAHYFASDINARFAQSKVSYKPEMANAQGYANLAEAMLQRDLPTLKIVRSA